MRGKRVGTLSPADPLHRFLADTVRAVLGQRLVDPVFDVTQLDRGGSVYRYRERSGVADLVGKFFGAKLSATAFPPQTLLRHEFDGLRQLRSLGLDNPPHRVVRPLATSEAIGFVLVEDFVKGTDLDSFMADAAWNGGVAGLGPRVEAVAHFLADLHTRSAIDEPLAGLAAQAYLDKITRQLLSRGILGPSEHTRLTQIRQSWDTSGHLVAPSTALVHGDPTPPHFLFDPHEGLTVIDLERLRRGDPASDLGRLAAELKHLFLLRTGDAWSGEPCIQRLYQAYAARAEVEGDFDSLTTRGRYYMGVDLLRVARNSWLDLGYRRRLVEEGFACLQG